MGDQKAESQYIDSDIKLKIALLVVAEKDSELHGAVKEAPTSQY